MACILARDERMLCIRQQLCHALTNACARHVWIGQDDRSLALAQRGDLVQMRQPHAAGREDRGIDSAAHSADVVFAFYNDDLFDVFFHTCLA